MKFKNKIALCMVCVLSILFGIGGSILISMSFHTNLKREQQEGYDTYQMVLGTLQVAYEVSEEVTDREIVKLLSQIVEQNAGNWTGIRLYTNDEIVYEYGMMAYEIPDIPAAIGSCKIQSLEPAKGVYLLALSGSIQMGKTIFFMDMIRDVSSIYAIRQQQQWIYLWVFCFMAILCLGLSYTVAQFLTQPLVTLSKVSQNIASGNLSSRADVHTKDEIGMLAQDFNQMAETLEQTIVELKETMEKQERFMGSFAHEMRTPMTSIVGYGDLLRSQVLTEEEQVEAANYIVEEGKRLQNLSQKLLMLFGLKHGKMDFGLVEPALLLENIGQQLKEVYAGQGIALTWECDVGMCVLECDLVTSLVLNLIENARRAMDKQQGSIHISCTMVGQEKIALEEELEVVVREGCKIVVQDNGRGIPEDALKHITEAFYRVDKSRARTQGGVGLGLALSKEIVMLHHGTMAFTSQLGVGTKVTVELKGGFS